MTIEWLRDLVISILGILSIIILIGVLVGLFVLYLKSRKLIKSMNRSILLVRKWLAYIMGLFKGLNEAANIFGKGGS